MIPSPDVLPLPASRLVGRPPRALLLAGAGTAIAAFIPLLYLLVRASGAGVQRVVDVLANRRTLETV